MGGIHVEPWAPEYGSPVEFDPQSEVDPGEIDNEIEVAGEWHPIREPGDPVSVLAFVDGVRRPEARITVDDGEGLPVPGLCGTYAVGAVLWYPDEGRSEFGDIRVGRVAACGDGRRVELPPVGPGLVYRALPVPDRAASSVMAGFHNAMRVAEWELAEDLALGGYFVIADGPLNILSDTPKVGYIKTHRTSYLPDHRAGIIGRLAAGQRTPVFLIPNYERYSWYLRLPVAAPGHSWSGVVRCEVAARLGTSQAIRFADRTTTYLPEVASQPHRDPRAPQNLVPIFGLEAKLQARLGNTRLLQRQIIEAVQRQVVPV